MSTFRVLHILDMAGQGALLCHFLAKDQRSFNNTIIKNECFCLSLYVKKGMKADMLNEYYESIPFRNIKHLLKTILFKKFQIAHIHSAEILIPFFKLLGKKIILHYHGSDINIPSRKNSIIRKLCRNMADIILYNDQDMTIPTKTKCVYFPDIIDTELFRNSNQNKAGSLIIVSDNLDINQTLLGIPKSTIIFNSSNDFIPYKKMPEYLSQFETYIDEKVNDKGQRLNALSNTGLQALACGLKVEKGGLTNVNLPPQHHPNIVIPNLIRLYDSL